MRKAFLLFIALLLFAPAQARAEDQTITFTLFARGWPPFEMMDGGIPHGMAYDLFKAILPQGTRSAIEANPAPRKRLYVASGPVYSRLECPEWVKRKNECLWTEPLLTLRNVLYSPEFRPLEYEGLESLEGKTIGCIKNYVYPEIETLFISGRAKRYDVNSDLVLLRMVKAGRIDAAVMDSSATEWVIRHMTDVKPDDFYVSSNPVDTAELRFAFNKAPGWEKRLPEINARIKEIRENGMLEEITARYR